ncbi:hypothetical protein PCYB_125140, partial [Plasmodium cynomolgi strain B]
WQFFARIRVKLFKVYIIFFILFLLTRHYIHVHNEQLHSVFPFSGHFPLSLCKKLCSLFFEAACLILWSIIPTVRAHALSTLAQVCAAVDTFATSRDLPPTTSTTTPL